MIYSTSHFVGSSPAETVLLYAFVISNLGIFLGYGFIAAKVMPLLPVRKITYLAGTGFFFTCGLTHLEHVIHSFLPPETAYLTVHSQIIHLTQVVFVWVFAMGFFADVKALLRQRSVDRVHRRLTDDPR